MQIGSVIENKRTEILTVFKMAEKFLSKNNDDFQLSFFLPRFSFRFSVHLLFDCKYSHFNCQTVFSAQNSHLETEQSETSLPASILREPRFQDDQGRKYFVLAYLISCEFFNYIFASKYIEIFVLRVYNDKDDVEEAHNKQKNKLDLLNLVCAVGNPYRDPILHLYHRLHKYCRMFANSYVFGQKIYIGIHTQ